MNSLACTRCKTALPEGLPGVPALNRCPGCDAEIQTTVFPAFKRAPTPGAAPELILETSEAACFYHPEKRAATLCEVCGRFLCALCDLPVGRKHYCPACVEAGSRKGRIQSLERGRARYDQIVWALLILPLPFILFIGPITASAAFVLALWKWRANPSLVAKTRLRLALGLALALVELGVAGWFWGFIAFSHHH